MAAQSIEYFLFWQFHMRIAYFSVLTLRVPFHSEPNFAHTFFFIARERDPAEQAKHMFVCVCVLAHSHIINTKI